MFDFSFIGWNIKTLFSALIILITIGQAWSLNEQAKTIKIKESGRSASLFMFTASVFFFITATIYGFKIHNLIVAATATVLCYMHIPPVLNLLKYKKMSKLEHFGTSLFIIGTIATFIASEKEVGIIYSFVSFMTAIPLMHQMYTLWKEKNPGVLEPKMLITFIFTSSIWLVYAFVLDAGALKFSGVLFTSIRFSMFFLWYYYKTKAAAEISRAY